MLIPQSFKVRHKILQFLAIKRSEQIRNNLPLQKSGQTIDEISKAINISRNLVDQQLNKLWDEKDVIREINTNHPNNPASFKYYIDSKGVSKASSKEILNEGQLINSQLFNNYSSGFFQIIVGLIALFSIYQNFTTIESLKIENKIDRQQLETLSKAHLELKEIIKNKNEIIDTVEIHKTKIQPLSKSKN